jgi:hypothetical protein
LRLSEQILCLITRRPQQIKLCSVRGLVNEVGEQGERVTLLVEVSIGESTASANAIADLDELAPKSCTVRPPFAVEGNPPVQASVRVIQTLKVQESRC